jgi:hypothetical protein
MMIRYLSPIALILWATCSTAAIQNSDFWFHDDGDTIFIDGKRGAPLHIDYIGAALTQPLTVRVTPNNPKLKIVAPTCTFTKKDDDCRLTVQNAKEGDNVYGVNQFTLTEVGGSRGVLNAQAASDTNTVGFGVGVQGKDMPQPVQLLAQDPTETSGVWSLQNGRVIVANRTSQKREYQSLIKYYKDGSRNSPTYALPSGQICYIDDRLSLKQQNFIKPPSYPLYNELRRSGTRDITNPSDEIYNLAVFTGNFNITTCSANGDLKCASNKWDSWTVGLANLSAIDLDSNAFKAEQIQVLQNNTWDNDTTLYYKGKWSSFNIALLLIQGSIDGSPFDPNAAAPNIQEINSAPPCSDFIKGDPIVTNNITLNVYGPGSVKMQEGARCNIITTPHDVTWTRCIGSGIKDRIYEITAIPEAGKTFKGWNSKGLCDDSKTTCWFQLTSDVTLDPYFW